MKKIFTAPTFWIVLAIIIALIVGTIVLKNNSSDSQTTDNADNSTVTDSEQSADNTDIPLSEVVKETYERTVSSTNTDAYSIQRWYNYYEMADGTWLAEINQNNEDGQPETYSYKYRIILHGPIEDADESINYVYLSNTTDITFEQAWEASGLSCNSNDYFDIEDALYVETWLGELGDKYSTDTENTIFINAE